MKESVFRSEEGKKSVLSYYNNILSMFPLKQRYLDTSYGKTFLLEAGSEENEAVILLHGSCGNSAFWLGDIPVLAEKYHVFSADIPGEAGNSEEFRYDLTSDAYALWIKELFDALMIKKAVIIGNSLGSWMALNFAVRFPEKINKLVILAASGLAPIRQEFIEVSEEFVLKGRSDMNVGEILHEDSIPKPVLDFMKLILDNFIPITGQLPLYSDIELGKLKMPVLFIAGEKDTLIDAQKSAERLNEILPFSETHILKDCGHAVMNAAGLYMPFMAK